MMIKDIRSMKELLFVVGTFTNTISLFDTQGQICYNERVKVCVRYFYHFFIFSLKDSPSNYEKCFLFHLKSSFRCQDTPFL